MTPVRPWALLPYLALGLLAAHEARSLLVVGGSSSAVLAHPIWGIAFLLVAVANIALVASAAHLADTRPLRLTAGAATILVYGARAAAIALETDLLTYPQQAGFGRTITLVVLTGWACAAPLRPVEGRRR